MIKLFGFLTEKGWEGVVDFFFLVYLGVGVGMFLLYYFLIYKPFIHEEKPLKYQWQIEVFKAFILILIIYYVAYII
jgi:hypothetical protein